MHQQGKRYVFGFVKVGKKGQIVLPKEARTAFGIEPGDSLMLVGDEESGLSILTNERLSSMLSAVLGASPAFGEGKPRDEGPAKEAAGP